MVVVRLYKGTGWISNLIKWQTRSQYSHSALITNGTLYEAREFKGVLKRLAVDDESVEYDDFTVEITKDQQNILIDFLERQLGKGYDYLSVLRFITRQQSERKESGKFFCSEYVFAAFQKAGINLLERIDAWAVSPELLAISPKLKEFK